MGNTEVKPAAELSGQPRAVQADVVLGGVQSPWPEDIALTDALDVSPQTLRQSGLVCHCHRRSPTFASLG